MTTTPELPELRERFLQFANGKFDPASPFGDVVWQAVQDALAALAVTKPQEAVKPGDVLRWAAGIVQLYDDATMQGDYMIDANDAEQILKALADYVDSHRASPQPAQPAPVPAELPTIESGPWNVGNDFLPFHRSASHVSPEYRAGWNDCYEKAREFIAKSAQQPTQEQEKLSENQRLTWITDLDKAIKKMAQYWRGDSGCGEGLKQIREWLLSAAPPSPEPDKYDISNAKTAYWASHCPDCNKPTAEGHIHTCSPQVVVLHPVSQINVWADMYERQGGHALIVQMLRSYAALANKEKE